MNLETIIDMQSWCRTLATQWIQSYPCKTQNFSGNTRGACKSSWSQIGSLKSFTLTIPWNSAKLVKISPGIIVRRHHTDQKQMGMLKGQFAELKWGHLRCYCSPVWITNGVRIPLNAIPIFETFKISDGKTPYERRFGKP